MLTPVATSKGKRPSRMVALDAQHRHDRGFLFTIASRH
jgi:hypothetical protein